MRTFRNIFTDWFDASKDKLLGILGGTTKPVTTVVGMLADAFTWMALPTTITGALDYFYARGPGSTNRCVGLIKPDLTLLPSGSTKSAKLYLTQYQIQTATATITLYRILSGNSGWTEAGADWDFSSGAVRWAGDVGGDGGADAGCSVIGTDHSATAIGSFVATINDPVGTIYEINLDITEFELLITNNYGIALRSNVDSYTRICTKEHANPAYRPYGIVITGG